MAKYAVLFRGGGAPQPEMAEEQMKKWAEWMSTAFPSGDMKGEPFQSHGKIVSGKRGKTIKELPPKKDAVGGYIVIDAESYDRAVEKLKGCPIFMAGGKAEVREIRPM